MSMPWSFPSDAVIVRARGRHEHERWVMMKPEFEDMWNLWMVWTKHCTDGYWLIIDIVPWWGTWSEQYEGSTHSEESPPSGEVDILPPAEAEPVEMPPAEAEPVEKPHAEAEPVEMPHAEAEPVEMPRAEAEPGKCKNRCVRFAGYGDAEVD